MFPPGHLPPGHLPPGHFPGESGDGAGLGWEDDDVTWGGLQLSSKDFAPIFIADGTAFYAFGYNSEAPLDVFLERRAALTARGKPVLLRSVWPHIEGPKGYDIQIWAGGHETPQGEIDWEGPYNFTIGEDTFTDFLVSGRYIAIRFSSSGTPVWSLQSYDLEFEVIGVN